MRSPEGGARTSLPGAPDWLAHYDEGVPPEIQVPAGLLTTWLERAARTWPRRAAVWSEMGPLSYQQLLSEVQRFSAVLASLGVRAGDRVMLFLPNCPQLVVAFYGTLWRGAIAVLMAPETPEPMLRAQIENCSPKVGVAPRPLPDGLAEALRHVGPEVLILASGREYTRSMRGLLRLPRKAATSEGRLRRWRQEMQRAHDGFPLEPVDQDSPAVIEYTGGTTGSPRGVVLTHRSLVANVAQLVAWDPKIRKGDERILSAIPFSHAYGLTACLNLGIHVGATVLLMAEFTVDGVFNVCERFRPTLFPGVPAFYTALLSRRDLRQHGLDSIRACISGSAPLPVEIQEGFEKVSKGRLVEGFGMTEASPVTHANPLYGKRRSGSIGLPLPSTEARIIDLDTGEDLPPGRVGELVVRGPQLMQGYWNNPERTARVLRDGWLHTGDIAQRDAEGYFYVINRKSDALRLEGRLVFPRDVEEVLYEHPAVQEAAVVGWPPGPPSAEPGTYQEIRAYIVPRGRQPITAEEVQALCQRRLPRFMVPARVEFLAALPRTGVGKLKRRDLLGI